MRQMRSAQPFGVIATPLKNGGSDPPAQGIAGGTGISPVICGQVGSLSHHSFLVMTNPHYRSSPSASDRTPDRWCLYYWLS